MTKEVQVQLNQSALTILTNRDQEIAEAQREAAGRPAHTAEA